MTDRVFPLVLFVCAMQTRIRELEGACTGGKAKGTRAKQISLSINIGGKKTNRKNK